MFKFIVNVLCVFLFVSVINVFKIFMNGVCMVFLNEKLNRASTKYRGVVVVDVARFRIIFNIVFLFMNFMFVVF